MSKKSAADNIVSFLKENHEYFAAAHLQRMDFKNKNGTSASPKAISRRLQEMAEGPQAILEVEYRHNNAYYRIKKNHRKITFSYIDLPDGSKKQIASYV